MNFRKIWKPAVLAALTLTTGAILHASPDAKPKNELISGSVTCLYCYASDNQMSSDPDACKAHCITKRGLPAAIIEEGTGAVYVVVGKNGEMPPKKLVPFIGKKVNAQGPIYRKNGVSVIEVLVASEAME